MNTNLTEILIIQDRSGSMSPVREGTISGFNEFVKGQKSGPGDANLTLVQFDNEYLQVFNRVPLTEVPELTTLTYEPRGCTALYDAACRAIDELGGKLAMLPEEQRPGKVVVMIQTDGEENASRQFNLEALRTRIEHQTKVYSWTFMFFGANIDAYAVAQQYGIGAATTAQYLGDMATTKAVYSVATNSVLRGRLGQSMDYTEAETQSLVK